MTDDEWKELGLPTDKEMEKSELFFEKLEDTGVADTQKYFDRMHDKVFSMNNILIAAYFALIAIRNDIPNWILIIPVANSIMLLNIDYRMLKRSRLQSRITTVPRTEIDRYGRMQINTNWYSLLSIYSTIAVVLLFGYFLFQR
ncbi:hypothetical protein M8998_07310 [Sphingobacterium sp. lm-10]|uniref:hypothetical protein n=1 Tax=Sphingobacterium sp. lm-10 TaxID=2944904 RepID=UPI002020DDBC|nr:hypothetical protein [Sphingobacterium sp. lm-10]MCL7987742.1 hypothetical protein [Sphingobacterium sp. lm-10]